MNSTLGKLGITESETKEGAVVKLAEDLSLYLSQNKNKGIRTLFLSSGGSSLSVLDYVSVDVLGDYLTIGVLDERYDETNKNNNFTQLTKTEFYEKANKAGCGFIDTSIKEGQSQEELASFFEKELKEWRSENSNGEIIATVGIGIDGHTSGIMPFLEDENKFTEFFESDKRVVSYDATGKNSFPERVTTTMTFLKQLNRIFVLITGSEKSNAFLQMQKEGSIAEIPARILKNITGRVYVDEVLLKR